MLYVQKFFKTEKAAKSFQKKHGGALYADVPGSRTREDYCVAWNIVGDGPIRSEAPRHEKERS